MSRTLQPPATDQDSAARQQPFDQFLVGRLVNIDGRALAATRPTFGGSLLCTIMTLAYRPQMATMRPRTAPMPRRDESRSGEIGRAHV